MSYRYHVKTTCPFCGCNSMYAESPATDSYRQCIHCQIPQVAEIGSTPDAVDVHIGGEQADEYLALAEVVAKGALYFRNNVGELVQVTYMSYWRQTEAGHELRSVTNDGREFNEDGVLTRFFKFFKRK